MHGRFYRLIRDLHLYLGLFISPFVVVYCLSVFFLVHSWLPKKGADGTVSRTVTNVPLPANLDSLSGRPLVDTLQGVLAACQVDGEIGFVRRLAKEHRLLIPVVVPGRDTSVTLDLTKREAQIEQHDTGFRQALVLLHKSPGQHLAAIRMNWIFMRIWRWFADATVYLLFFISVSGVYLWCALRAERSVGLCLLAAGAISFFAVTYALSH